jgi:hypothetical protein
MQEDQILPTGITPKKPILKHNKWKISKSLTERIWKAVTIVTFHMQGRIH